MTTEILLCEQVTKRYGSKRVVDHASFALYPGEILSILGPSGGGKTTLLRLIAGFETLDEGEIRIRGDLVSTSKFELPPEKRSVGMIFQEYMLFPHLTVAQNVLFGVSSLDKAERRARLGEILDLVRLVGLEDRSPNELSGGEQQRVALARSLAPRPSILLMDEPFSNIDTDMRADMRREVEEILRDNHMTTVFVTHDRDEAFSMGDRIGVMGYGRLEQIDIPEVLHGSPSTKFVARMTSNCGFIEGKISGQKVITELGSFAWKSSESVSDGDTVFLVVHAGDFVVNLDPGGTSTVELRDFRGDDTIITVRLNSGNTLPCRMNHYSSLSSGSRVALVHSRDGPFFVLKKYDS